MRWRGKEAGILVREIDSIWGYLITTVIGSRSDKHIKKVTFTNSQD